MALYLAGASSFRGKVVLYIISALALIFTAINSLGYVPVEKKIWKGSTLQSQKPSLVSLTTSQPFQELRIPGFDVNLRERREILHDNDFCTKVTTNDSVYVQKSFFLDDDLFEIARELDSHPMVQYPLEAFSRKNKTSNLSNVITNSWNQLAASCAFLASHRVHLCVSRIIFRPTRPKDRAFISFMRGRIFDENWNHLHGYELKWQNSSTVFPTTFDVGTVFKLGGKTFGPEDPRIIVDEVAGAEPVIVFNMALPEIRWLRGIFIYRPFTHKTTLLTIHGVERHKHEKNWTPFFLKHSDNLPSKYIHFVQNFAPLTVLKCGLADGVCDVAFNQSVAPELLDQYSFRNASIRGGTQFVSIPCLDRGKRGCSSQIEAFVSFPRHHVEHVGDLDKINKPGYRPEIAILLTNSSHFYIGYISGPLDFGPGTVMRPSALNNAGGDGRIMIANSIASWNVDVPSSIERVVVGESAYTAPLKSDIMTLTLSVNDDTVQVMRIAGLYQFIRKLPSMAEFFGLVDKASGNLGGHISGNFLDSVSFETASLAAWSIRTCAEGAAKSYTLQHSKSLVDNLRQMENSTLNL